jgi:5,10-methylenetetrahydromethanopterin reductase
MATFSAALLNDHRPDRLVDIVRAVDGDLDYEALFVSDERFYKNTYAQLALVARNSSELRIGTGVTNPYTRNPALTAAGIATVEEIAEGRTILGLGAGTTTVLDRLGIDQKNPIGTVRDAVKVIRRLHDGDEVSLERPEFELHDLELDFQPGRRVPIYVAGRGPQILSLGGHVADGVIAGAGLSSVAGMEYARERVAIGSEHGDRSVDDIEIVCWAFLSIGDEERVAYDAVAPLIAEIVRAVPTDALSAIGIPRPDIKRMKDIEDPTELSAGALREALTRDVIEQFCIAGTPDQCRAHVERLIESGVGHVAVLPFENDDWGVLENLEIFSDDIIREVNQ